MPDVLIYGDTMRSPELRHEVSVPIPDPAKYVWQPGEVELELHEDGILIRSLRKPRASWDAAFKTVSDIDDDQQAAAWPTEFEKKEWQW